MSRLKVSALRRDPLPIFKELAARGDISEFSLGRDRGFLVSDPEAIETVLVAQARSFAHEPVLHARWIGSRTIPARHGLAATDYSRHNQRRRELHSAVAPARDEEFARIVIARAAAAAERWRETEILDVEEAAARLAVEIVVEALFGGEASDQLVRDAGELLRSLNHFSSAPFRLQSRLTSGRSLNAAFERTARELAALTDSAEARQEDTVGVRLRLADGTGPGTLLPHDGPTVFAAGVATLTAVFAWTWSVLATHLELQEALAAELDQVLDNRPGALVDLPDLTWARMISAETMRLYPPNWFIGRRALSGTTIGGVDVPRGAVVVISPFLLHRDPRFFPDPDRFSPQRFSDAAQAERPKNQFIPFGAGTRRCLAERLAWLSEVFALATIARRFRFLPVEGRGAEVEARITLAPAPGFVLRLEPRERSGGPEGADRQREELLL